MLSTTNFAWHFKGNGRFKGGNYAAWNWQTILQLRFFYLHFFTKSQF